MYLPIYIYVYIQTLICELFLWKGRLDTVKTKIVKNGNQKWVGVHAEILRLTLCRNIKQQGPAAPNCLLSQPQISMIKVINRLDNKD